LGIGDWGLGIGDWAQSPIPNPQSPIPIPKISLNDYKENSNKINNILKNIQKFSSSFSFILYYWKCSHKKNNNSF
jgi:hypothetical protein